ncbi:hypothetical protein EGT74_21470 [Chitinophaga lutea]|uniref:Uncharacterized protein n=1 Tax=Chitinophaga lutea TaxID=2488634 RepID=A0A3N4PS15_9BACT|nr:ankyrin repeat domain-containing protein [Chitinophaga lutea]RPE09559.1 hypothetical protein EGT74_21470 [Chitinophaga lutea]
MTQHPLADAIKRNSLEDARQRIRQGEKLPAGLPDFDKKQVFDALVRGKAFDLIDELVKTGFIETDLYEYERFDGTIFESLFRNLRDTPEELAFLQSFVSKLDNINDALQDKTLLETALLASAPLEVIKVLIAAGCSVHYKNNYEIGYLYKVVQEFGIREELGTAYLELLIGEGVDPNEGNVVNETALHLAVSKHKKQYIDLLLRHGADPNLQNKSGESPYYYALVHQVCGPELYQMLKAYAPPDFNSVNKDGESLFVGTVRMRRRPSDHDIDILKTLIADGADPYQTAPYYGQGKSALDWIVEQPAEALRAVLDTGAVDVNRKDDEGNTLLHKVCAYNVNYDQEAARQLYRKAKLLLDAGADVNSTNDADQTPMMLAAQDNLKAKTVELLVKQ